MSLGALGVRGLDRGPPNSFMNKISPWAELRIVNPGSRMRRSFTGNLKLQTRNYQPVSRNIGQDARPPLGIAVALANTANHKLPTTDFQPVFRNIGQDARPHTRLRDPDDAPRFAALISLRRGLRQGVGYDEVLNRRSTPSPPNPKDLSAYGPEDLSSHFPEHRAGCPTSLPEPWQAEARGSRTP